MDQNSSNNPPQQPAQPQTTPPPPAPTDQNASFFAPSPSQSIPATPQVQTNTNPFQPPSTPVAATLPVQPPAPESPLPAQLQSINTLASLPNLPPLPNQPPIGIPTQPIPVASNPIPNAPIPPGLTTSKSDLFKAWLPKIILIVIALAILAEVVIYAPKIMTIFKGEEAVSTENIVKPAGAGLTLTASKTEYAVGDSFKVSVILDTNNAKIQSADVVLKYNPTYLEADQTSGVTLGKIFGNYPVADINNTEGTVRISGTNGVSSAGFTGLGELANITFKAKAAGSAAVSIEYIPNSTADSNVVDVDSTEDVLKSIENLNITIK